MKKKAWLSIAEAQQEKRAWDLQERNTARWAHGLVPPLPGMLLRVSEVKACTICCSQLSQDTCFYEFASTWEERSKHQCVG